MGIIEKEYFLIVKPRQDFTDHNLLPSLTPDEDTAALPYSYEKIPLGSRPLIFTNGFKESRQQSGQTTVRQPPDILFEGSNPLVRGELREKLLHLDVPNLEIQPAIYIDDWDDWHEDYWYLTFTEYFDCWDRKTSAYQKSEDPIRLGGEELHMVHKYRLNERVIQKTPLRDRLLFQMGGSLTAQIVAHISIAHYFAGNRTGAQVISLEDFPDGY